MQLNLPKPWVRLGRRRSFSRQSPICPVKDTSVLDRAISHLQDYDWLVLTSANAADVVLDRKAALGIEHFPENLQVAAIGPKQPPVYWMGGIAPHFTPEEYVAEAILPGLGDLTERWVLLPLADIAHDALPQAIQKANGIAHVVTAYHTLPAEPDPDGMAAIRAGVDIITFTSGSTARNFVSLMWQAGLDPFHLPGNPIIACIGPKTAQTAQELGFSVESWRVFTQQKVWFRQFHQHLQKIHPHDTI
jgi:uroporphyrinogen-III synthase